MPYSPPTSPLNTSWTGAGAYGGAKYRVRASWGDGTAQVVFEPVSPASETFGSSAASLQSRSLAPSGVGPGAFGSHYGLTTQFPYAPSQYARNASWVGASPYTPPFAVAPATFSVSTRLLGPVGLAAGGFGSSAVYKQLFITSAGGISTFAAGTATYVLRSYEYKPPQWTADANWAGKPAYTRPVSTCNASFVTAADQRTIAQVGFNSAAFGTTSVVLGSRSLLLTGIAPGAAGTPKLGWTQYVTTSGLAGAVGTPTVANWIRYLLPSGIAGALGTPSVINTTADQHIRPSGVAPVGFGTPSVSPRIIYPAGFVGAVGTPDVQRNPSPLGFDSAVYGTPTVEYRTKLVTVAGIYDGDLGIPEYANRPQSVANAGVVQTAIIGDTAIRNRRRVVAPAGDDQSFVSHGAEVSNRNRALLPTPIAPGEVASQDADIFALPPAAWADNDTATAVVPFSKDGSAGLRRGNFAACTSGSLFAALTVDDTVADATNVKVTTVTIVSGGAKVNEVQLVLVNDTALGYTVYDAAGATLSAGSLSTVVTPEQDLHGRQLWPVTGGFLIIAGGQSFYYKHSDHSLSQRIVSQYTRTAAAGSIALELAGGDIKRHDVTDPSNTTLWTAHPAGALYYDAATDGTYIYGADYYGTTPKLYRLNPADGSVVTSSASVVPDAPVADGSQQLGQTMVAAGGYLYILKAGEILQLDPSLAIVKRVPSAGATAGLRLVNGYLVSGTRHADIVSGSLLDNTARVYDLNLRVVHKPGFSTRGTEVWNYADTIAPAGISSLQMGRASDTGVGFHTNYIAPSGVLPLGVGSPVLTKTPELLPVGIAAPSFGYGMVAPRVREVATYGHQDDTLGSHTAWFRVRYVTEAGQLDSAEHGTAAVEFRDRRITETTLGVGTTYGAPFVSLLNRTLAPTSIAFDVGLQFGAAKVQDATQRVLGTTAGTDEAFGTLNIERNERFLRPVGITGAFGSTSVELKTRFITSTFGWNHSDVPTTGVVFNSRQILGAQSWEAFGAYGTPSIENRNRVIRTYGVDGAKVSTGAEVANKARLLSPAGSVQTLWGDALVAYRNRSVAAAGFSAGVAPTYWNQVYNLRKILEPSGIARGVPGFPYVWDNTQRIDTADGGRDTSLLGTPFVAPRIRYLDVDRFGATPPAPPHPYIGLLKQYVSPPGMDPVGFGAADVIEHFNVVAPFGISAVRWGESAVRNLTPELRVGSMEAPDNLQRPYVGFRVRSLAPAGATHTAFGSETLVQYRTRYLGLSGINSLKIPLLHRVKFDIPEPPVQQLVLPSGFGGGAFGLPTMNYRFLYPGGFAGTKFGAPTVRSQSIYVLPYNLGIHFQCGIPSLNATQYVDVPTIHSDDELSRFVPEPRVSPFYLYISEDHTGATVLERALVDYKGWQPRERPFFGTPEVSLRHRKVFPTMYPSPNAPVNHLGTPGVDFRHRRVYPSGIRPKNVGYPEVPGGWEIFPKFAKNGDLGDYFDPAQYGNASVSFPAVYDPYVRPAGAFGEFGEPSVEHKNRTRAVPGWDSSVFGTQWVHPPIRLYPEGAVGVVGTPWVSHRVRTLLPEGLGAFNSDYETGSFNYRVLTVRRRDYVRPIGAVQSIIPAPTVMVLGLGCVATLGDTSAFGRARLGACAC